MHKASTMAILLAFIFFLASCGSVKKAKQDLVYLREGSLDSLPNLSVNLKEATIQKGDHLSITIYSDNPEATSIFNQVTSPATLNPTGTMVTPLGSSQSGNNTSASGYLVDPNGDIRFHLIGKLRVEGLTRTQVADTLAKLLQPYLMNPYADVRFINLRVTIMGEVMRPGLYNIPESKLNVLGLIGMAGDVSIYGRKDNVLVIRETGGKREFGRLDLRKSNIFQSPFFYLQPNDMVIVEPNMNKQTATEQENLRKLTLVTSIATLVSTVAILVTLFK